jgi:hypothetical protein
MQFKSGFGRFLHFYGAATVSFRAPHPEEETDVNPQVFRRIAVAMLGALARQSPMPKASCV